MSFTVAIVGRPNVGKSTLFNRLIGEKKSIIDDISGVTRDRIYGECFWNGRTFNVIDTGGFVANSNDIFERAIRDQVKTALAEADRIIFVTDTTTGITDLDASMANLLRARHKDVYLAVNKVDNAARMNDAAEFYGLGFENIFFIASITGSGTGELLDAIIENSPDNPDEVKEEIPKIAIIGQPNVGKSSMVNAFMGTERNIVTDVAGTTRDSIHARFNKFDKDLILIDTAGIRRKTKVTENLEFYSVIRAIKAIDEADVCILVIDATKGITHQDLSILGQAIRKKRGIVIAINKWDLIEKDHKTHKAFETEILNKMAPFTDVPVIFTSTVDKTRLLKVLEESIEVYERRKKRISTSKLNDMLERAIQENHPPANKGKFIKIKYVTQLPSNYPSFAFFCNLPKYIKEPYRNYLEKKLRAEFDFKGVPLTIYFREK